jgi:hypothetical protein
VSDNKATITNPGTSNDISAGVVNATFSLVFDRVGVTIFNGDLTNVAAGKDPRLATTVMANGGFAPTLALKTDSPAIDFGSAALTKLTAAISSTTQTSISVVTTEALIPGKFARIDSEIVQITGVTNQTTAAIARGQQGTTAATHAVDADLDQLDDQRGPGFARKVDYPTSAGKSIADIGAYELQILPKVANARFSADDAESYSRVNKLVINFDQPVQFLSGKTATDAVSLKQINTSFDPGFVALTTTDNGSTGKVTFTFSGTFLDQFGSLKDGYYRLAIVADYVHIPDMPLAKFDGNGNGNAEGSPTDDFIKNLPRNFGDSDGDGDVDAVDFAAFRAAFGGTTDLRFDFDGDGDVDAQEFGAFRARFGTSVVVPP